MLIKFQRNISTFVQQLNYIHLGLIRSHLKLTVFFQGREKEAEYIPKVCLISSPTQIKSSSKKIITKNLLSMGKRDEKQEHMRKDL